MKAFTQINSPRTHIRRFQREDQIPFVKILSDTRLTNFIALPKETKSPSGSIRLLSATIAAYVTEQPLLAYAIVENEYKECIGMTGISPWTRSVQKCFMPCQALMYYKSPDTSKPLNSLDPGQDEKITLH